jgi:hypothetical protein
MMKKAIAVLAIVFITCSAVLAQDGIWLRHDVESAFNEAVGVCAGDFNGDGYMDVAASDHSPEKIVWWANDGQSPPVFIYQDIIGSPGGLQEIFAIDLDKNGTTDILSAADEADDLTWWDNDGHGNFTQRTVDSSFDTRTVYACDIDNDSDNDVVSGSRTGEVYWYRNNGTGNFTKLSVGNSGGYVTMVHAVDFDGDGHLEILVSDSRSHCICWWKNNGAESFSAQPLIADVNGAYAVHAADLDGDQDVDILGASYADACVAWWENDGTNTFGVRHIVGSGLSGAFRSMATDINGDNVPDVVASAHDAGKVIWWDNYCQGSFPNFSQHVIEDQFPEARRLWVEDMDSDGAPDILCAGDTYITWWENPSQSGQASTCDPEADLTQPYGPDDCTILLLHFDEDSGAVAQDASSHGNNGTVYGADWIPAGKFSGTLHLDGYADEGGDSVKVELDNVGFMAGPHTLEAWIYPLTIGTQHTIMSLYGKGDQIPMYIYPDGRVSFRVVHAAYPDPSIPDSVAEIQSTTQLQPNNWYHVAGVWDGCEMAIYVDGVKENSLSPSFSPSVPPSNTLDIGKVWTAASTPNGARSFFNGYVDELRISSIARTFGPVSAEICDAFLTSRRVNVDSGPRARPDPGHNWRHDFKIHVIPCEPMDVSVGDSADVFVDVDTSGTFDEDEDYLAIVSSTDIDGGALDIAIKVYIGEDLVDNDPCVALYSINHIPVVDTLGNEIDYLCLDTFDPHAGGGSGAPVNLALQNHPNPFNPETEISYTLPAAGKVRLTVYNMLGQKVKTLVDEYQAAGHKTITWDGADEGGNKAASGVYFYRVKAGEFEDTKKMILMK